jgi:hypothetical protein
VVKASAGRAGSRVVAGLAVGLSRHTAPRTLLPIGRTPRVTSVDDFALRRRHRCATVIIDAGSHERIDVLPGRTAGTLEAWLPSRQAPPRRPARPLNPSVPHAETPPSQDRIHPR